MKNEHQLKIRPLTPSRWKDLELLFGSRGACAGCWCMWWRLARSDWERQRGEGNRRSLRKLVEAGPAPGLLGYVEGQSVAWCAVAPREHFPVLERSRILRRVDGEPVWSVVCLFISKAWRKRGLSAEMLKAAALFAGKQGARILEGYPVEAAKRKMPDVFAFTGLAESFRKTGFTEAARRSPTRPIMRCYLGSAAHPPARRRRRTNSTPGVSMRRRP